MAGTCSVSEDTKAIAENEAVCGMQRSLTHFSAAEQQSLSLATGYFQGKEEGLIQIFLTCYLTLRVNQGDTDFLPHGHVHSF